MCIRDSPDTGLKILLSFDMYSKKVLGKRSYAPELSEVMIDLTTQLPSINLPISVDVCHTSESSRCAGNHLSTIFCCVSIGIFTISKASLLASLCNFSSARRS